MRRRCVSYIPGGYLKETKPETGYYVAAIIKTNDEVNGSFNSGITSALTIGYTSPSNIGLNVSVGYVESRKYEATSENYDMRDPNPSLDEIPLSEML